MKTGLNKYYGDFLSMNINLIYLWVFYEIE